MERPAVGNSAEAAVDVPHHNVPVMMATYHHVAAVTMTKADRLGPVVTAMEIPVAPMEADGSPAAGTFAH